MVSKFKLMEMAYGTLWKAKLRKKKKQTQQKHLKKKSDRFIINALHERTSGHR